MKVCSLTMLTFIVADPNEVQIEREHLCPLTIKTAWAIVSLRANMLHDRSDCPTRSRGSKPPNCRQPYTFGRTN